ncbi:MAG: hypothetical protein AB2556_24735 [Candidatus Thiodiazotropha sp.]
MLWSSILALMAVLRSNRNKWLFASQPGDFAIQSPKKFHDARQYFPFRRNARRELLHSALEHTAAALPLPSKEQTAQPFVPNTCSRGSAATYDPLVPFFAPQQINLDRVLCQPVCKVNCCNATGAQEGSRKN